MWNCNAQCDTAEREEGIGHAIYSPPVSLNGNINHIADLVINL